MQDDALDCMPNLKPESLPVKWKKRKEIELTVTGRKTRKPLTRPVWFALRGNELLLLPVTGTDTHWYKNILQDPQVNVSSEGQTFRGRLLPITERRQVEEVIELFKEKYGASDIRKYYPNPNVAASLRVD